MKNIHILPTDKPSRIAYYGKELKYSKTKPVQLFTTTLDWKLQNIYITSDEEIKEGDWYIHKQINYLRVSNSNSIPMDAKKIILTTDQDLIKNGIQLIPDEFLEWFVKNPSCEKVEISYGLLKPFESTDKGYMIHCPDNECSEEPKQETLEEKLDIIVSREPSKFWKESDERFKNKEKLENASEYYAHNYFDMHETNSYKELKKGFIAGAKWQAEQHVEFINDNIAELDKAIESFKNKRNQLTSTRKLYSEKEMFAIIAEILHTAELKEGSWEDIAEWFKQFKKNKV